MKRIRLELCVPHLLLLASLCCVSGCAVQPKEIVSPYQTALRSYYEAAADPSTQKTKEAQTAIDNAVQANPGDLEARVLLANVYLLQMRAAEVDQPLNPPADFFRQLQLVVLSVGADATAKDWVLPRAYTTTGDYLLLLGQRELGTGPPAEGEAVEQARQRAIRTKGIFDAAHLCFGAALSTAKPTEQTMGLRREQINAREGYIMSLNGSLTALSRLGAVATSSGAARVRQAMLQDLATAVGDGEISGNPVTAGLDPTNQRTISLLNNMLADTTLASMREWAARNPNLMVNDPANQQDQEKLKELEALYTQWTEFLERTLSHGVIENALKTGQPGNGGVALSLLQKAYTMPALEFVRQQKGAKRGAGAQRERSQGAEGS